MDRHNCTPEEFMDHENCQNTSPADGVTYGVRNVSMDQAVTFDLNVNYIGQLQELCAKSHLVPPHYSDFEMAGKSNDPTFRLSCSVGDIKVEREYRGKKAAVKRFVAFETLQVLKSKKRKLGLTEAVGNQENQYVLAGDTAISNNSAFCPITSNNNVSPGSGLKAADQASNQSEKLISDKVEEHLEKQIDEMDLNQNYPSQLIQLCRKLKLNEPKYTVTKCGGPSHDPIHNVKCEIENNLQNGMAKIVHSFELKLNSSVKKLKKIVSLALINKILDKNNNIVDISEVNEKKEDILNGSSCPVGPISYTPISPGQNELKRKQSDDELPATEKKIKIEQLEKADEVSASENCNSEVTGETKTHPDFNGMVVAGNYLSELNILCQKRKFHPSFQTLERSGEDHNPTFLVECTARNESGQVEATEKMEMKANLKTIKKHLAYLMLKKLRMNPTIEIARPSGTAGIQEHEQEEMIAQLKELKTFRSNLLQQKQVSSSDNNFTFQVASVSGLFKGQRIKNTPNKTLNSFSLLQDIIREEKKYGRASLEYKFLTSRRTSAPPRICFVKIKINGKLLSFPGVGDSYEESKNNGASKALDSIKKHFFPSETV